MPPQMKLALLAIATAIAMAPGALFAASTSSPAALTKQECSACHLQYPSFLLPKRSWGAIMGDLSNHFGEDASLDDAARAKIEAYLKSTAADSNGQSPNWLRAIPASEIPLRISGLPWFQYQHGSRVKNWIKSHPEVGTISNCTACHRGAEKGYFDDE
ncbi:MAG: cytochrome C [Alphaproteobacteria bacterium]|nr:cytochrome C [Alphaproteobacteria bacterium]